MRRTRTLPARIAVIAGAAVLLAACTQTPSDPPSSMPPRDDGGTAEPGDGVTTIEPVEPTTIGDDRAGEPGADPLVDAAVEDLASRLDIDSDEVRPGALTRVTWSDGAIGCPQPDRSYTQALVAGTLLELSVGGSTYRYHGEGEQPLFLCEMPQAPLGESATS